MIIDASSIIYTQEPACGYSFTSSFTYEIPDNAESFVKAGRYFTPSIEVFSLNPSDAGDYTLEIVNTILIDDPLAS